MNILLGFFRNTEAKGINQWSALGQSFVHPIKQMKHGWGREKSRYGGRLYFVEHNPKTGQYDVKKPSAAHNKPPVVVKSFPDKESALKHRNKWNKLSAGAAWGSAAAASAAGVGIGHELNTYHKEEKQNAAMGEDVRAESWNRIRKVVDETGEKRGPEWKAKWNATCDEKINSGDPKCRIFENLKYDMGTASQNQTAAEGFKNYMGDNWGNVKQSFRHPIKQTKHGFGRFKSQVTGNLYFVEHNPETNQYDVKKSSRTHNRAPIVVKSFPDKESALKHRNKWNKLAQGGVALKGLAAVGNAAFQVGSARKLAREGLAGVNQNQTAGIIKPAAPTSATPKKKMGLGKKLAIGAGALAASLPAAALAGYGASKVKQAIDKKKDSSKLSSAEFVGKHGSVKY